MKLSGFLSIFVFLILTGCASLPENLSARRVEPGETPVLNQDEVMIFGRIFFIVNGKNKAPYGFGRPIWHLTSPEPKHATDAQITRRKNIPALSAREDGVFAYVIPAGRYEMGYVLLFFHTPIIAPSIEFDAREPGYAYYLGDLEVDVEDLSWLEGHHLNYLEVVDRFDMVRGQFEETVSGSDSIRKALLTRMHGRIPKMQGDDQPVTSSGSIKFGY